MGQSTFVPALELSRTVYEEVVRPAMASTLPSLPYSACLIGSGSEVLGFDTERSTDHEWGVRLQIFLADDVPQSIHNQIDQLLRESLPPTIHGVPTFAECAIEQTSGGQTSRQSRHGLSTGRLSDFLQYRFDVQSVEEFDVSTWLTVSEQNLLEVTRGGVWRDDSGDLTRTREALRWYPDDVWRYRLAAGWKRIDRQETLVGRTGEIRDELGSHIVSLAIIRDLMSMAFLIEQRYAPYEKWFGSAFSQLSLASLLSPLLNQARLSDTWQEREAAIVKAESLLAEAFNELHLCKWVDPTPRQYLFNRPFQVVMANRFTYELLDSITDPVVKAMPGPLGGIDQYMNTTKGSGRASLNSAIRTWLRSLT